LSFLRYAWDFPSILPEAAKLDSTDPEMDGLKKSDSLDCRS